MRVLIVEDDRHLRTSMTRGLREASHVVEQAPTGEQAIALAKSSVFDVMILDVRLPGVDGLAVCRAVRAAGNRVPILMLTALDDVDDRIAGLDAGADDYLTKPFDFGELLARLRALARRGPPERGPVLRVGDLELDPAARRVRRGETDIELSTKEFQLLEVFMRNPGAVLSRFQLLEGAWDTEYEHRSNVIDVYVRYLREKIDRPFGLESLETVRGAGYRLRKDA